MVGIRLADRTFFPILEESDVDTKHVALIPASDGQDRVEIVVVRDGVEELGRLLLEGLSGSSKTETDISLTLKLDQFRNLNMTARDVQTGNVESRVVRLEDHHVPPPDLVPPREKRSLLPWLVLILLLLILGAALVYLFLGGSREEIPAGVPAAGVPAEESPQVKSAADRMDAGGIGAEAAEEAEVVEDPAPSAMEYLIKRGDTLWDISEKYYGTPWRFPEIAGENQIPNPDLIYPDRTLLLPGK